MPDDILKQFVLDHGLKEEFQEFYGELDLHQLAWSKERISAHEIETCSTKYDPRVQEIADRHATVRSVREATKVSSAVTSWIQAGTWPRPPVFLFGVLSPPDECHLIEGHTRVGALLGLRRNPHLDVACSHHDCWVGREAQQEELCDWKEVRRANPLAFKDWLYDAREEEDEKGRLASILFDAEQQHRYDLSNGKELGDLVKLVAYDPSIPVDVKDLRALYEHYRRELAL